VAKTLYIILLLVIVGTSSFFIYDKRESYASLYTALDPCKRPISFRVDNVDKRFGLNREEVIGFAQEAADIWNKGMGRDLFAYSESGTISVNMVFDSRQQASEKISELDRSVDTEKSKLDSMIRSHQTRVADFKKRLAEHNVVVNSWNSRGGAPPEEFEKLIAEQNALETEASNLNREARSLNIATEDYNLQVGQLNETIADFNQDLSVKPEEGLFIGEENKIEIYFNIDQDELVHTITHEFGHARGVDHNNNPKSIMYPFSTTVTTLSAQDLAAAVEVCRERSLVEVVKTRLNF